MIQPPLVLRDSVVGVVTRLWTGQLRTFGSIFCRGKRLFSIPVWADVLLGPPSRVLGAFFAGNKVTNLRSWPPVSIYCRGYSRVALYLHSPTCFRDLHLNPPSNHQVGLLSSMGMRTQLPSLSQSHLHKTYNSIILLKQSETWNLCFRSRHIYVQCDNTFIYKPVRYNGSDFDITEFRVDNWAFDITENGWDIWAFVFVNLGKFIRGWPQAGACGIYGRWIVTGTCLYFDYLGFPLSFSFHQCFYSHCVQM
jgi:hypothetical protein